MDEHPALRHLERLLDKDPMLRDIVAKAIPRARRRDRFVPEVEVLATADRYVVVVDLPGMERSQVRVRLDGARLIVEGVRRLGRPAGAEVRTSERASGTFRREFSLPSDVLPAQVRARMVHGVLTVSLPRMGDGSPVEVDIE